MTKKEREKIAEETRSKFGLDLEGDVLFYQLETLTFVQRNLDKKERAK